VKCKARVGRRRGWGRERGGKGERRRGGRRGERKAVQAMAGSELGVFIQLLR
jgi:hypothetical protein